MHCSRCGTAMDFRGQQRVWICGACGFQVAGPMQGPPVAPNPRQLADQQRAHTLVMWSHLLGWGGLGVLVFGSIAAGTLAGPAAAGGIAGLSILAIIVGAVLGQIGRAMQGRVI